MHIRLGYVLGKPRDFPDLRPVRRHLERGVFLIFLEALQMHVQAEEG